jgi:ATP-binding cassette subfamily C protein
MSLAPPINTKNNAAELSAALARARGALIGVGVFSAVVNVLALTGSIYMLQVYDRVLTSRSTPTLVVLTALMIALYLCYGLLDLLRTRIMTRVGLRVDRALRQRIFGIVLLLPLRSRISGGFLQATRDLEQLRSFLSSPAPIAVFDLPWLPFYLALVYMLHPWLGLLATAGAFVLVAFALMTELKSGRPTKAASSRSGERNSFAEAAWRNAEIIHATGQAQRISSRWSELSEDFLKHQVRAVDVTGGIGTLSRVFRMILQSAQLGLGAYIVIHGEATAGIIIAASIMTSRAYAPIEIAIAHWRSFIGVRESYRRLKTILSSFPQIERHLDLPRPNSLLTVERLTVTAPGETKPIVHDASFSIKAGDGVGIIGPSASGKSTLARALVGAWLPAKGGIRLDGATLDQWRPEALGRDIGYVPQNIEFLSGTIAENISRFDPGATSEAMIAAARVAGVHEMILRLGEGYETRIGEGGTTLSGGQRQRLALARALYGDPFLVVLDEPNSNLDADGESALTAAIRSVRERGGIVITIAHRPSALMAVDKILVMANGRVQAFGPKDEILARNTVKREAAAGTALAGLNA